MKMGLKLIGLGLFMMALGLLSFLTGCSGTLEQMKRNQVSNGLVVSFKDAEEVSRFCTVHEDPFKKTRVVVSPKFQGIKNNKMVEYYVKSSAPGSYALEIYTRHGDAVTELRDMNGNVFRPLSSQLTDVRARTTHVAYQYGSVFVINKSYLAGVTSPRPMKVYFAQGGGTDFKLDPKAVQGLLLAAP